MDDFEFPELLTPRFSLPPSLWVTDDRRYGFQPHRIALWIYWQALVLILKGLPLQGLPSQATKEAAAEGATHPVDAGTTGGQHFTWRPPPRWPWNAAAAMAGGSARGEGQVPGKAKEGGGCPFAKGGSSGAGQVGKANGGGGCPFAK